MVGCALLIAGNVVEFWLSWMLNVPTAFDSGYSGGGWPGSYLGLGHFMVGCFALVGADSARLVPNVSLKAVDYARLAPTERCSGDTPTVKRLLAVLRSRGGMVAILGAICVLIGPSIGTIAAGNAGMEVAGVAILLTGYLLMALGIVMIVVAIQRARSDSGPTKAP